MSHSMEIDISHVRATTSHPPWLREDLRVSAHKICSKCEQQSHNVFYVDNSRQVEGGLCDMLSEKV